MADPAAALARAAAIADDVFFPHAIEVDVTDTVPASHLDLLAADGFYGLAGPTELGGLDSPELAAFSRVVETLAGGCLATTFVWLQHHGAVRAVASTDRPEVRERWLRPLCAGERRAGVVQAALRPGPSSLRAHRVDGGYVFEGSAPWVSGWGMVDTLHTAARTDDDTIVWALVDAGGPLTATPQDLVAVNASRTVAVRFDAVHVPDERVVSIVPHRGAALDPGSLRLNGALALGVADRCARLLGGGGGPEGEFADELGACRAALDHGDDVPAARARAAELALRLSARLVVAEGAKAVLRDHHGQRLTREATFLLVFGTRAPIQAALLDRLRPDNRP
jgi:alkylation response protein AidB-like acyl-CoA dehydrogenase